MKILHIISSFETGGAQRLLSDLLPLLAKKEDISILIFNDANNGFQKKITDNHITLYNIKKKNFYNPFIILQLIPILRKYEIVHVHLFPCLYWVAIASIFSKTHLVYTEHSTNNKRRNKKYFKWLEKWIYGFYEKIISISEQTQDNLKIWLNATPNDKRFVVIENGIDIETFTNFKNTSQYDSKMPKGKRILMISRFTQSKDQETLIRAMMYTAEDIHLLLAGEGETQEKSINLTKQLHLENRVHFLGTQTNIPLLISLCDIGVQSSNWEGFGLTAVEIMAGHKPVIASDVNGLKQVVNGAGILFPPKNEKALAERINALLQDKTLYNEISEKCYERACKYDIHKMTEKYMAIYEEILKNQ